MNRTLNERTRIIRLHADLSKMFWAEAINTAAYLINRSPSVALEFELSEGKWSGKKVSLSHLKTFGCVAYVYVDSEKRDKFDAKAKKYIFIGYGTNYFGYRFWDKKNRKIIWSRDATFNENKKRSKSNADEVRRIDLGDIENPEGAARNVVTEGDEVQEADGELVMDDDAAKDAADDQEEPNPQESVLRRSTWVRKPNTWYLSSLNYLLLTDSGEPEDYMEAVDSGDAVKWELAMKDALRSLEKNMTWVLTRLPDGKRALQNK
jgi:hypothetical protein